MGIDHLLLKTDGLNYIFSKNQKEIRQMVNSGFLYGEGMFSPGISDS